MCSTKRLGERLEALSVLILAIDIEYKSSLASNFWEFKVTYFDDN